METPKPRHTRRHVMASLLGAGATATLASEIIAGADSPGREVADRASSIRLTALVPHVCGDRIYLELKTNHSIRGWGEIKGVWPKVAAQLTREMFALLDGKNPTHIEDIWQSLYRAHRNHRGGPFMVHCISGIDNALWDIAGKLWGVPVYRLLGGPVRKKIRYYPHAKAVKLGSAQRPHAGDPAEVQQLVEQVRSARKGVGPDGTVMYDAHSAIPPALLQQFATAIEPYDLLFIEEPAVPGNVDVFKRIHEKINVPIATGERVRTIWEVLPYLNAQAVDILQPDAGYTGGISQMKKIAALAEAHYVPLAPHCTQSYLGQAASLHCTASIPLFLIHEAYNDPHLGRIVRRSWEADDEGYYSLPEGPGVGVEIDEAALAKEAANPKYQFRWRDERFPDGSVTDY